MYPCRHRSPLLAVAMSLVVALCLKLNNGRFGVANGGRHGEVGTSSHHRSCRDGIQPWQLVPQGHHAAERVTSAFLLSCKERRIQQHKSKRGHRESSWGGPSRTAALAFSLRSCFFDFGTGIYRSMLLHIATWACESCTQSTQQMRRSGVQSHLPGVRSRGTVVLHFTPPSTKTDLLEGFDS